MRINSSLAFMILISGFSVYGQDDCTYNKMIAKIDSISKAQNIEAGNVYILKVSSTFDKTDTKPSGLTTKSKFYFDGPFLVLDEKYFNINKLLYFYIKNDTMEFFFQGY